MSPEKQNNPMLIPPSFTSHRNQVASGEFIMGAVKEFIFERMETLNNVIKLHFKDPIQIIKFKYMLNEVHYNDISLGTSQNEKLIVENIKIFGSIINMNYENHLSLYPIEKDYYGSLSYDQKKKLSEFTNQRLNELCAISLLKSSSTLPEKTDNSNVSNGKGIGSHKLNPKPNIKIEEPEYDAQKYEPLIQETLKYIDENPNVNHYEVFAYYIFQVRDNLKDYKINQHQAAEFFKRLPSKYRNHLTNSELFKKQIFYKAIHDHILQAIDHCCVFELAYTKFYVTNFLNIILCHYPLLNNVSLPKNNENGVEEVDRDFKPVECVTFNPPRPEPFIRYYTPLPPMQKNYSYIISSTLLITGLLTKGIIRDLIRFNIISPNLFNIGVLSPSSFNTLIPVIASLPFSYIIFFKASPRSIFNISNTNNFSGKNVNNAQEKISDESLKISERIIEKLKSSTKNIDSDNSVETLPTIKYGAISEIEYYAGLRPFTQSALKSFNKLVPIIAGASPHCEQMDKVAFQGGKDLAYITNSLMRIGFSQQLDDIEVNPNKYKELRKHGGKVF